MLLPSEVALAQELNERFRKERHDIVRAAFELFDAKGKKFDVLEPFWHRHKDAGALVHEIEKKARRLGQVHGADPEAFSETPEAAAHGESVLEQLIDLINYPIMLHWLLTAALEQEEELGNLQKGVRQWLNSKNSTESK